jgi:hypothetical protein
MTTGTNLPNPTLMTIKNQKIKVLFDHIFCRPSQNQPPHADSTVWKDFKSLVHTHLHLCKIKSCMENPHMENQEFTVFKNSHNKKHGMIVVQYSDAESEDQVPKSYSWYKSKQDQKKGHKL